MIIFVRFGACRPGARGRLVTVAHTTCVIVRVSGKMTMTIDPHWDGAMTAVDSFIADHNCDRDEYHPGGRDRGAIVSAATVRSPARSLA